MPLTLRVACDGRCCTCLVVFIDDVGAIQVVCHAEPVMVDVGIKPVMNGVQAFSGAFGDGRSGIRWRRYFERVYVRKQAWR